MNRFRKAKLFYQKFKVKQAHKKYDGKKAILHYPPLYVTIGITGYCGFKCIFCVSHSKDAKDNHQYKVPFKMKFTDFTKIVDSAVEANVPHIHISGLGEPLLHKDFFKMYDYVTERYFYSSLQTDFFKPFFEKNNIIDKILARKKKIHYITTDLFPQKVHEKIKLGSDYNYLMDCLEELSKKGNIKIYAHQILTKQSYKGMTESIEELKQRGIKFQYDIVNLHPTGFNEFTQPENAFVSTDHHIINELERVKKKARQLSVKVTIPKPSDAIENKGICLAPWSRIQIMPSKKLPRKNWAGNAITSQCIAEAVGDFFTIGNVFDYDNFMDFWNNSHLVQIRKNMMQGIYPDSKCKLCYKYKEFDKKNFS